jgi:3-mercaptopyruvate sulfurtransferase SseA
MADYATTCWSRPIGSPTTSRTTTSHRRGTRIGLYAEAHIPGAIGFDWKKDLQDQVKRTFS